MQEPQIYQAPQSSLSNQTKINATKLYSPTQVACGTLGGPIGLIYFLASNFNTLGNSAGKMKVQLFGSLSILLMIASFPIMPEDMPSTPFTIVYILIARFVCEKYQMTKAQIIESTEYDFHSNWRVFGFAILCLIVSAVVIFGSLFILLELGIFE